MNNCQQVLGLSKISIAVASILLAGCSSGGGSSSTGTGSSTNAGVNSAAWIAPITTGVPQVGQSTEIATSSSGLKTSDLMNVINNGGTLTTKSVVDLQTENINDGGQLVSNADIEMTFQADGQYTMKINEDTFPVASIHNYGLDYVGEYGILASAEKAVAASPEIKYAAVIAGIRTDNADIPSSGEATYTANEDSYYDNYVPTLAGETPVPANYTNYVGVTYGSPSGADYDSLEETNGTENGLQTNGNFTITLDADFTQSTVQGSAQGVVSDSCCNASSINFPLQVIFDESSIAQSSFNGSGTANVDNQNIPINYAGNFFGPGAAEAAILFEGKNENSATISGFGYLGKD